VVARLCSSKENRRKEEQDEWAKPRGIMRGAMVLLADVSKRGGGV